MNEAITQTLAGRIALITLLPFSISELKSANLLHESLEQTVFNGFHQRIYVQNFEPTSWYRNYTKTYLERDVRQLQQVQDLALFQKFMQLCVGRIGKIILNFAEQPTWQAKP